jgi:flagellar motor switch protein FliN
MDKSPLSQAEIDALLQAAQSDPAPAAPEEAAPVQPGVPMSVGENGRVVARPVEFEQMVTRGENPPTPTESVSLIMDIPMEVTVELGRARKLVKDVLAMTNGSVVELDKQAGEPVDILVNGRLLARGEVVVIDENFGVRISEVVSKNDRVAGLR